MLFIGLLQQSYFSKLRWPHIGRCGDYNKVHIGVCSLYIKCCGQVQVFLSQIFFDIVILNRRLAVIDQVNLLRDNIHSRHLMVLRKQCSN